MRDEVERIVDFELTNGIVRHVLITEAVLAGDLGHLRVRYILRDSDAASEKAQEALERSAGYVARSLADSMQLQRAPKVVFSFDKESARMRRLQQVLDADRATRAAAALADPNDPGHAEALTAAAASSSAHLAASADDDAGEDDDDGFDDDGFDDVELDEDGLDEDASDDGQA